MCRILEVSRSGYYRWRRSRFSAKREEDQSLVQKIKETHASSNGTYGSPRIWSQLRKEGFSCGRNRVARLMKENGIRGKASMRKFKPKTTNSSHRLPVFENLLPDA